MKTITKKMLSVLMAVLVLLGGIGISLAIEPFAEEIVYDTVIDYSDTSLKADNFGAWNFNKLGAEDINRQSNPSLYICKERDDSIGLNVSWGDLGIEWGSNGDAFLVYKVAADTKFEATFAIIDNGTRTRWATEKNTEFEFKIEASSAKDGGWKNAVDTKGKTGTKLYDHGGGYIEEIVVTYDVPADCEYVKVTMPQKGILPGTADTRLNDFAYFKGVKMFKVKPAPVIKYDTTFDYTTSEFDDNYGAWNYTKLGAVSNAEGGSSTYMLNKWDGHAGVSPQYGVLAVTWGTANPYLIYKVAGGTKFEATFALIGNDKRTQWKTNNNAEFEFKIEASNAVASGWKNAVDTTGLTGTALYAHAGSNIEKIVVTYDVPEDCEYVKITFPQKGILPGTTDTRLNDFAYLAGVKMFKVKPVEYDTTYDYSPKTLTGTLTDSNKAEYGVYAINSDNSYTLSFKAGGNNEYDGGLGIGWGDLGNEWGTKNKAFVVYKVKAGTKFQATFRMLTGRTGHVANAGTALEATIEASANGTDGWTNLVDTAGKEGTAVGGYTDYVITYDVPADCNYVKITLPQQGTIPNTSYRGNDLARIMGVKYFKYVEQGPAYTNVYDYTYADAAVTTITNGNKATYGIYALNTDNAHKLNVPTKIGGDGAIYSGGIGGDYGDLDSAWGTKNKPYAIYKVEAGKPFEATFRMLKHRGNYTANVGTALEATIEASVNGVDGWTNLVDTAGKESTTVGGYEDITITYNVPADCQYVKITLPMQGIIPDTTYRGNDLARIMGVKCFGYVPPTPTYDTIRDYSDPTMEYSAVNGGTIANYGIYSYNNSVKAPALVMNESIGNDWRGGIGPGFGGLGAPWGELENPYVVYEVKPGTFFEATIRMIADSTKDTIFNNTGEPFEATIEASTNDISGWKNKVDTTQAAKTNAGGGYNDYVITYEVPVDCSFVKITLPQKGIVTGTSWRGNDFARIMKVRLNAAKNYFEGTDTVMNYKANGAVDFFYDNDAALIYLYKSNGIVVDNFSNGAAYVAPSMSYLNSGSNIAKPYAMYAIEGGTKFVAAINVNRAAAAALGNDFAMKIYESVNGADWTEATTVLESVGDIDYFTFETAANTKFVKVEFPHTDAVKSVDKVNEVYGILAIAFNPNESAYEITNPYGNYTFKNVDKFYSDAFAAPYDVKNYGIFEDIGGVFVFEAAQGSPYNYLAYGWGNLINNNGSDYCGLVYSVKPGTAFQAVGLLSRNNGDVQIVEKATGKHFDFIVQISSNGKTWTDYNPSRILTDKSLMTLDGVNKRYVTEVITIPVLPSDAKFVKILYPHTASVKVMTDGADNRAGNDFLGLSQVSYTKGDAVPAYLYEPDRSNYEDIYDFTSDIYNLDALNVTGLEYNVGLGALTPGWGYFYQTGKNIREKCAATVSVKEGTAFFLDFGYRPERVNLMEGEDYRVKLYFSSDCNNWTDVTDKYVKQVAFAGTLTYGHRFEIDKLPAGVKYVKIEYPHDHDMRGDVTALGKEITVLGNDNCGINKLFYTADEHRKFENEIKYGHWYEEFTDFPEDIDEKNAKVLGLYDYTKNAFKINDHTSSEAEDGRIVIKENYIFNKKDMEPVYLTYNVKPGTEFFMRVMTSASVSRLTIMPTARMKLYASETGEAGSWKEITNYFFTDKANNAETSYYVANVGAKTNFIKVEFPNKGDLVALGLADGASGADYFAVKEVYATLVNYDGTWDGEKNEHNFKKPELNNNNKVDGGTVVVKPFNWLYVIIPVAAALVLAAAAVVVLLIVKKKKNAAK